MKKIYIPGLSTTKEELHRIRDLFHDGGIEIDTLISDYVSISKMSKRNIERVLTDRLDSITDFDDAHLICHSMGCNLGVIASKHPTVQSLTLVSPEFRATSKQEQQAVLDATSEKYQDEEIGKIKKRELGEQLLLVGLFLRSRRWALKELSRVDVPIRIYYSEGDPFVSRKSLEGDFESYTRKVMLETSNHNPFLSERGPQLVKKIRYYIGE